jgi:putative lipoprotein
MEQDEPAMTLENTDWILVELGGESVEADVPLKAPTLRFDSETGMVAGNSGVNQYGGGYTLTDGVLAFGPMRSTMMAGPPEAMALEQAFLAALSGQKGWRILEGRFELLEADKVTAVFVVAPAPARAVVSGTVSYREKIRLRPGSVLEVTLEAISKQDVKAEVLASFRQEDPAGPPFAFELKYDPAVIDPRFTYSVRARITRDGKLIFTSDTIHPVITRDHGNQVEIPVIGVGGTE